MKLLRIHRQRRRTVPKTMGTYTVRHRNVIPKPGMRLTDSPTYRPVHRYGPVSECDRRLQAAWAWREGELNALLDAIDARADAGDQVGSHDAVYEHQTLFARGFPR